MRKIFTLALTAILCAMTTNLNAQSTYSDANGSGLYFEILDASAKSAKIVYNASYASKTELTVPANVKEGSNTYKVTEIGESAFENCTNLEEVIVKASLSKLGDKAFAKCSNITYFDLWGCEVVGDSAFAGCSKFTGFDDSAVQSDITSYGNYAFAGTAIKWYAFFANQTLGMHLFAQSQLEQFGVYGDGLTLPALAENGPFYDIRENITYVELDGLTSIPARLCAGQKNAKLGIYDCNIKSILPQAFEGCEAIDDETMNKLLGTSLTVIAQSAFKDCKSITNITLPASLTTIRVNAFDGLSNLKKITAQIETPLTIQESVFANCGTLSDIKLVVADELYEAYSTANVWKDFHVMRDNGLYELTINISNATIKVINADTEEEITDLTAIADGTKVKFEVTPNTGYRVSEVPAARTITHDETITVRVAVQKYTLKIKTTGEGQVKLEINDVETAILSSSTLLDYGTRLKLTAVPAEGYVFKGWDEDNDLTSPCEITLNHELPSALIAGATSFNEDYCYDTFRLTAKFEQESATGIDDIDASSKEDRGRLIFLNGQVLILRGEKIYTITGQEMK